MSSFPPHARRKFLKQAGLVLSGAYLAPAVVNTILAENIATNNIKVSGHLWVYASAFPPDWDSTPVLEKVFADLSYAGLDGVELMEVNLRHENAVEHLSGLAKKYKLPVTGTSYNGNMWDATRHAKILADLKIILPRLSALKGKTLGISVGDAKRQKTEAELDAQANILKQILKICKDQNIEANLHNHTYEVTNNMHDLKGTLARIPDIKLGPDLNWLIRGGIDPVWFIDTYGKQITYLHLRDQYADGTWTEYLGQGNTDFAAIAQALKRNNFNGRAAIELAFPNNFKPTKPLQEDWKLSREYVKKTFGW
jgi:sugar phosphate isomerase/epimerase